MDNERIIQGLIVILICVFPIIVLKLVSVLKEKKLTGLLFELAQTQQTAIIQFDQWNNSVIGLSKDRQQVFTISIDKKKEKRKVLTLSSFDLCNISKDEIERNGKKSHEANVIDLLLSGKNAPAERIIFYDKVKDGSLTNESGLAEKWCKTINECIKGRGPNTY